MLPPGGRPSIPCLESGQFCPRHHPSIADPPVGTHRRGVRLPQSPSAFPPSPRQYPASNRQGRLSELSGECSPRPQFPRPPKITHASSAGAAMHDRRPPPARRALPAISSPEPSRHHSHAVSSRPRYPRTTPGRDAPPGRPSSCRAHQPSANDPRASSSTISNPLSLSPGAKLLRSIILRVFV